MKHLLILSLVLLSGCVSLAPEYPTRRDECQAGQDCMPAITSTGWSDFFTDERLRELIRLGLANNRDLRITALNIDRARALHRIRRSERFPSVDARADALLVRDSTDQYVADIGVSSFELDFFGRVRNLSELALQEYFATEEAHRSAHISLVAEIATAYLFLAADKNSLRLAAETLDSERSSYDLTARRFELGAANGLELSQSRTTVEAARSEVARLRTLVAQGENLLALIIGSPVPPALLPEGQIEQIAALDDLPDGVSAEVLQQRPDILSAEHRLRGAYANIGAARARFYPSITLTGAGGTGSTELSGLFSGGSFVWSLLPRVTLPIFNAGRNRANLEVAETDRDILLAEYERAIQSAFREVSDALAERANIDERLAAQRELVEATSRTHELSTARFRGGVDSYLSVLDAQRSLYSAQQNLIAVSTARLANVITLYRVFGGGELP